VTSSSWSVSGVLHLGGRVLALYPPGGTWFIHGNILGSTRVGTDQNGNQIEDVLFYPWGQFWTYAGLQEYHFAGFDYRYSADLDPTLNRTYTRNQGRWLSPDPLAGDITNPQFLNRCAYALNSPTTLTDPLGLQSPGNGLPCDSFVDFDCGPLSCDFFDPYRGYPVPPFLPPRDGLGGERRKPTLRSSGFGNGRSRTS
jgi:RHS repeat-associated protein